jgi:hypothetical protein
MEALFYESTNYTHLYKLLKIEEFNCSLAYMVDQKKHKKLNVTFKEHSIEVSNDDITIVIILFVGFENDEYEALKGKSNLHLITFNIKLGGMMGSKGLNVKYYNQTSLLFFSIVPSENEKNRRLRILKNK